ncbi:hypothetical protein [Persicobacter sp. CCB-QB2]|uniref:hypothetical protein n=1 Tax=Persicobacter sp. CCB-QB2 TaxID=1561025 RepID=UPI0006A9A17E|nr:hypothetical protein [Persicobacter sp. CCB-QB2]
MADINDLNNPNEENERKDEFDADNFGLPNVNFDNNEDQGSTFESDPLRMNFSLTIRRKHRRKSLRKSFLSLKIRILLQILISMRKKKKVIRKPGFGFL